MRDCTEDKFHMKFHQNINGGHQSLKPLCFLCHCNKLVHNSLLELCKDFCKADLMLVEASMFIG